MRLISYELILLLMNNKYVAWHPNPLFVGLKPTLHDYGFFSIFLKFIVTIFPFLTSIA